MRRVSNQSSELRRDAGKKSTKNSKQKRKEIIKTKAEISEIKNRKTEKMKETKSFLRRLITDTSLAILTKEKTIQDTNFQYQGIILNSIF